VESALNLSRRQDDQARKLAEQHGVDIANIR
jgi:hypothetical protein